MPARNRVKNIVEVGKDPMQEEDPYPTTKSDTGSHDQQLLDNTGEISPLDNPRDKTGYRARNLDTFEKTIIIVVIAVIANIIITFLLSCDAVNRRYDVSANAPDERIKNLERKVSAIDNRIDEFKRAITVIKTKLEIIETEKPWEQHVNTLKKEIGNLNTLFQDETRTIKEQMTSKEKIDGVLNVQEDLESLQQKVDTIDQEWKEIKLF